MHNSGFHLRLLFLFFFLIIYYMQIDTELTILVYLVTQSLITVPLVNIFQAVPTSQES